ncbi:glycosyl hydrolase family 17 protein [Pseudobacteriovorax antillogorgiicola]|uniref:Endo-1,3-beta-glucanase btgC n=1 Tax=Pseudobacteriovorax antillogorgiicola TaxID=1513793 RepID=A0A1Y6C553_9BACT|nr:glycosyl hydrolase family 17 protein [Pseudobacteriovorax antillogorgiicola]TCS49780.1 exo-beta-1,3-glucanase (GH17 family) [Pseudobacteriovorax antillogorgiicola]SMF42816.1 Exo-beta-1,3-glucanase, GH17 family [Pseudobacteriovorax antillogorgiicola]
MKSFSFSRCIAVLISLVFVLSELSLAKVPVVNYSPYRDGQRPGGPGPSEDQIEEDLLLLKNITTELRVYGMGRNTEVIAKLCQKLGLRLHVSAWLVPEDDDEPWSWQNYQEMRNLITFVKSYASSGVLASAIIGSEVLYRGDLSEDRLLQFINYAKQQLAGTGVPVSSAIIYFNWTEALAAAVDQITFHVHPMWEGRPIEQAAKRVLDTWTGLRNRFPDKAVLIGETGWASQGSAIKLSIPSEENQSRFTADLFQLIYDHPEKDEIKVFFFSAFDELWKAGDEGDVGAHWGLFRSDRSPKPVVDVIENLAS